MKVLIAVDESPESHDAVRFAGKVFGEQAQYFVVSVGKVPMTAVTLADPFGGGFIAPESAHVLAGEGMSHAEKLADEASEDLPTEAEARGEVGDPSNEICQIAEQEHVDVIVIGSHERSWLSKLISRSVRDKLVDNAPCPVLVVR